MCPGSILNDHPLDREKLRAVRLLSHSPLQPVDQRVPLVSDLVFDLKDLLPLLPLLLFKITELLLKLILLVERRGQA